MQARDDAGLGSGQVAMTQFYSLSDVVCSTNDLSNYSSLASTSVTLNGEITNTGGGTFTDKGFYVGTSSTATNNTKYSYGSGGGSWSQSITGLSSGTTYYVRSYTVSEAECLGTELFHLQQHNLVYLVTFHLVRQVEVAQVGNNHLQVLALVQVQVGQQIVIPTHWHTQEQVMVQVMAGLVSM